jgi:large subunit ribosomal protein L19e|tara:strand:+ start:3594 stop:4025 length:432 start_codon:yes stop_codon:yes gene_type:complete
MKTQKRIAAKVLKVGKSKIWIDPEQVEEVSAAMTRGDVRKFIGLGMIKAKPKVGNSRARINKRKAQKKKGRQRGQGKRKGSANSRLLQKAKWMSKIRAQRSFLKKLRDEEKITTAVYRKTYRLAKAGTFKSRAHVKTYLMEKK